jgi:hypothetical protein
MAEKKAQDHVISLVKAGLNAVPVLGGPIASLVGDYIPSSTDRCLNEFITSFSTRLATLEARVDTIHIDKDEFAELFKSAYLVVVRSHRKEKLEGAARLLSNILLREGDVEKLTYTELDHFIRALEGLSSGALTLHGKIVRFARAEIARSNLQRQFSMTLGHLSSVVGESNLSLLSGLCRELVSWGLVNLKVPQVNAQDYTIHNVELTELGIRFAEAVFDSAL